LIISQSEAAKILGVPSSTLSKRWKEASNNRKWPFRTISKLDKEILTLLRNVEGKQGGVISSITEDALGLLLKRRQELLSAVSIRLP